MSHLMEILLEDRRLSEARPATATYTPASRADKLIATGEHKRTAYRAAHPAADSAMVFGAQVGYLHGQVRKLCNECDMTSFPRDAKLLYVDVTHPEIEAVLTVGCTYSPGKTAQPFGPPEDCCEGEPEELEMCEIWVNGLNLAAVLSKKVTEEIEIDAFGVIQAAMAADDGEPL